MISPFHALFFGNSGDSFKEMLLAVHSTMYTGTPILSEAQEGLLSPGVCEQPGQCSETSAPHPRKRDLELCPKSEFQEASADIVFSLHAFKEAMHKMKVYILHVSLMIM